MYTNGAKLVGNEYSTGVILTSAELYESVRYRARRSALVSQQLQHVPGKNNGRADTLSRRPDYDQGTTDNQNVTVLPDRLFIRALASQDLEQDAEVLKLWVDPHKLKQLSGTWWKGNQLVITADVPLRRTIVQMHHDPPAYGHPGISRTLELTARRYWWPRMAQDVKDYVKGCADCQCNKVNNQMIRAPLSPICYVTVGTFTRRGLSCLSRH